MALVKFCKPEHNIHGGAQLRVGTLFGYRTIEDSDLRDEAEGKYVFHVTFPDTIELDRRWANLLLQGAIGFGNTADTPRFPGSLAAAVESLHIVEHRGESVVVNDTRIRIERHVLDCLIFCMSDVESANDSPFPQYNDSWTIPQHLVNEFGRRLGSLIYQQAKLSAFDEAISTAHSPATAATLSLNVRHQPVMYRDRELVITPDSKLSFDELVKTLSDMPFVKPKKYAPEREYRFVFELADGRRFFPPKVDHMMINPNLLTSLQ